MTTLEVGTELPSITVHLTRATLVHYAGASTDFNPIHWSERKAHELGLPTVIAHGMLTMGSALRVVTDYVGDPSRVLSYYVRFTRPVTVEDTDEGSAVTFSGTVTKVEGDVATIAIQALFGDTKVLGAASAEVRL